MGIEKSKEEKHLNKTIAIVEEQLEKARERALKIESDIKETRQDLRDNSEHSIGNLWGSEAFEALAELSQFTNELNDKITDGEETTVKIQRLENMLASPYFARIDFRFDDEDVLEKVYIGKTALKEDGGATRYVYDWRSPIASVFYRFMMGRAFYEAPAGRIAGQVELKRQYEIRDGKIEYYFDSDVQVVDEFLRKALSGNTSPQMKTIVETIQKEQDIVIRDMENELMMVQGVAGSGKTSIALHRAAYLMYQGLTESLAPEDILIISPNSLFEQYIANVLPELGEENADSTTWEDMARKIIKQKNVQSRGQFIESVITHNRYSYTIKSSMAFKNSLIFQTILNRAIDDLLKNQRTINGRKSNLKVKDIKNLYWRLLSDRKYFKEMSVGLVLPDNLEKILEWTNDNLLSSKLYYDDIAPLIYLRIMINGEHSYADIKQVVIDEAQDYYPLQFAIFKVLFPRAKLTILGDINQTLEKHEEMSLYEQISGIFGKKSSNLVVMDKSFRCTSEILDFSSQFLERKIKIESFNRNGRKPEVFSFNNEEQYSKAIINRVKECQRQGYASIGLICKTKNNAVALHKMIKDRLDIKLVTGQSQDETQGSFVIPVYMSKGLEFDAVLICDADDMTYCHEDDKNLLYIATTRALHQLDLFCMGEPGSFMGC